MSKSYITTLGCLKKGQKATITRVGDSSTDAAVVRRFMEMGFVEGSVTELIHEGIMGGDPVAVKVRGSLVALRRKEASGIEVRVDE